MTDTNQKLREALQALLASGGVIAEATDAELMAAIDDPEAEHIVKVQAAAVLNARQALALPTAAPVGERELPPVIAYRLDYPASEGVGLPRFFGADDGGRAHTFAFNHKATITELCDRAALSAGDAVDVLRLAVESGLAVAVRDGFTRVWTAESSEGWEDTQHEGDPYAATCRAIVDAALRKDKP